MTGGAPETVTPATGVVVDGRDLGELADTLKDLLADPPRLAELGRQGRRHTTGHWTWEIMGARLRELVTSG